MANKKKLQACKSIQPGNAKDGGGAVCDKRPGHRDAHKRRGFRARWN
jgi:hypothetical protein